jgi:hypothetical protein
MNILARLSAIVIILLLSSGYSAKATDRLVLCEMFTNTS